MIQLHQGLFNSIVLYFIVLALWGLYQWLRGYQPSGSYLAALIIGEGLMIVQAISGLLLVAMGKHPHQGLHWLYGAVLLLTLPVAYTFGGQRRDRLSTLYYGLGCALVVVVALVRTKATG